MIVTRNRLCLCLCRVGKQTVSSLLYWFILRLGDISLRVVVDDERSSGFELVGMIGSSGSSDGGLLCVSSTGRERCAAIHKTYPLVSLHSSSVPARK